MSTFGTSDGETVYHLGLLKRHVEGRPYLTRFYVWKMPCPPNNRRNASSHLGMACSIPSTQPLVFPRDLIIDMRNPSMLQADNQYF